jgi:hypothetical protein
MQSLKVSSLTHKLRRSLKTALQAACLASEAEDLAGVVDSVGEVVFSLQIRKPTQIPVSRLGESIYEF